MIAGLYYFRKRSWIGKSSDSAPYKERSRKLAISNLRSKGTVLKQNTNENNSGTSGITSPIAPIAPEDLEAVGSTNVSKARYSRDLDGYAYKCRHWFI